MATKRGTKGDYGCKVPKGGHRHGCGAGNSVFELTKLKKATKKAVERELNKAFDKLAGKKPKPKHSEL